jgi:flagellar FliJ protein
MAFIFRFQQLLQICIHEENEVKNRLALKDGQIAEVNAAIKEYANQHSQALQDQTTALRNGDMTRMQMYPAYLANIKKLREFQEEELERLIKQRERILQELIEKRKNRRTYEKLKEKDELAWQKQQQKIEQRNLDEFGGRLKRTREKLYGDA